MGQDVARASRELDAAVRDMVGWHFSPDTGTPFWLRYAQREGWDPREEVGGFDDLARFGFFEDHWLRDAPLEDWVPKSFQDKPYRIFETGGTTGRPKQRLDWGDYRTDYENFSPTLPLDSFPAGAAWLMLGPTGPRRLRLAIEYLANLRGGVCFHMDLDPRWFSLLVRSGDAQTARRYKDHLLNQGIQILESRHVQCLFTTPKLLQALCERVSLEKYGVSGVLCGGTSISPQSLRFLIEESLGNVRFVPLYGNTLMGLAASRPLEPEDEFRITYYAPQPRAVLQVVDPEAPERLVEYGERGRVKLTTLTRELFMPNFLERDEALRVPPHEDFPWDGVQDVRPFQQMDQEIVEGVY
jgi:phenylacetate-coenzyme A ligase PaaK-like adenylate-forming protein